MKKTIVLFLTSIVAVVLVLVTTVYFLTFAGAQKTTAGPLLGEKFERVIDGICALYLIDLGNGQLALIDAGNDEKGSSLLAALHARNKKPEDVTAIFLTHSHPDHIASLPLFPKATLYISKLEVPLIEGKAEYQSPASRVLERRIKHPFKVGHPLEDGEQVVLGNTTFRAFPIPGHTAGSTAYLVDGALFVGDSANYKSNGTLTGPWWFLSDNAEEGLLSLKQLSQRLQSEGDNVRFVVTAHTGVGEVASLRSLASLQ